MPISIHQIVVGKVQNKDINTQAPKITKMKIQVFLGAYRCRRNTLSYWKSSKAAHRPRESELLMLHWQHTQTCTSHHTFFFENELHTSLLLRQQKVQVQTAWKHSWEANKTPATSNKLFSGDSCNNLQKCHILRRNINLLIKSCNVLVSSKAQLHSPK